jgi:hypothetical protein
MCPAKGVFVMLAGPADNARQSLQQANVSDAALQCGPDWSSRLVQLPPAPSRPSGAAPAHQGHLQWKPGRQKQRSSTRVLLCQRRPAGCMHSPLPSSRPPGQRRRSGWRRRRRQQRAPRTAAAADLKRGHQVWHQPCICINTGPSAD